MWINGNKYSATSFATASMASPVTDHDAPKSQARNTFSSSGPVMNTELSRAVLGWYINTFSRETVPPAKHSRAMDNRTMWPDGNLRVSRRNTRLTPMGAAPRPRPGDALPPPSAGNAAVPVAKPGCKTGSRGGPAAETDKAASNSSRPHQVLRANMPTRSTGETPVAAALASPPSFTSVASALASSPASIMVASALTSPPAPTSSTVNWKTEPAVASTEGSATTTAMRRARGAASRSARTNRLVPPTS
mmetsp:Transcript_99224/g.286292  ORF Transcript_99224/g.286292 Transcript_99224/m.286292 type:complete len:248 (+) Transcript_99224:173-916(+)